MVYYHQGLFMPRVVAVRTAAGLGNGYSFGNDFYQIWLSSRELLRERLNPYSPEMTRDIQIGLYGRPLGRPGDQVDRRRFPYPAFADLLFWPTAELPFSRVRVGVVCVLAALTFASVLLWLRALDWRPGWQWIAVAALLTLSSYPALEGLYAGQVGLLVACLLAAAIVALRRKRFLLAGFLVALTTVKPQVTALLTLYLLLWSLYDWRSRNRFCVGFLSTMTLLVGTSLAVLPNWISSWIRTITAYHDYTRPPLVTEVLTSRLGPRLAGPATVILTVASILIALALAWRGRIADVASSTFWFTLSLVLSITAITILPGQAVYDHLVLLPGILLLARYRRKLLDAGGAPRLLLLIAALLLFWPWIAAFGLILLRGVLPMAVFGSSAVFLLPIRNAASLPFAVFALLAWTWRLNRRNQEAF